MIFEPVSRRILELYRSIPGEYAPEKATYVATQALQNLPWVASGLILTQLIPIRFQPLFEFLVPSSNDCDVTSPLIKIAAVIAIAFQYNQFSNFSKKVVETPLGFQKLYYLLLTYSTLSFIYDYFEKMFLSKEKPPEEKKELRPSDFTLGLLGMSFALQLRYAPISTLAGAAIGAYIRENPLTVEIFLVEIAQKVPEAAKKSISDLSNWVKEKAIFINPKTTEEKCYRAWLTWDFLARSISTSRGALIGGILQGGSLATYFRLFFPKK